MITAEREFPVDKRDTEQTLDSIEFSVVVPTRNRQRDLERCISSIGDQSRPPEEVIIVNDGELSSELVERFRSILPETADLTITGSKRGCVPGSGTARNTGMTLAASSVVVFLDDDTVLAPSYLDRLHALYSLHDSPTLAGIGGLLFGPRTDERGEDTVDALSKAFDRLFYQGTSLWKINNAGFSVRSYQTGEAPITVMKGDWIGGSNMSYKRDVVTDVRFPQWTAGREPGEDLMVGWQLKKAGYHSLIDPKLPLKHPETNHERDVFESNAREGRNRVRAFESLGERKHAPLFAWAMIGATFRTFLRYALRREWTAALGSSLGFLLGTLSQVFESITGTHETLA
ncbi:glycosyltransferase family 2 protein [Natronorubrum bangense]|uniref:Glycosyltransferase n=2 Tax=Natronorubrum bangense TaxID=61858 RepID=A0A4D6HRT9_9EURY|nr:glycosyltransferase family 2 protein [Natronorubrum bangense]ELY44003.1 glycosyltransferase [Natronorubrum bangense JCM 10635]QCC53036.1 glycosyltransferase [Natronorubrum bangense]QCC56271.1 glycosyltransferase [Natronorubrum bangense]